MSIMYCDNYEQLWGQVTSSKENKYARGTAYGAETNVIGFNGHPRTASPEERSRIGMINTEYSVHVIGILIS